jgi:hypothetical protein
MPLNQFSGREFPPPAVAFPAGGQRFKCGRAIIFAAGRGAKLAQRGRIHPQFCANPPVRATNEQMFTSQRFSLMGQSF